MDIAEEEIVRTSQEAVKAAMVQVKGELAFQAEKARLLGIRNSQLELYNRELKQAVDKLNRENMKKVTIATVLGGAGGVIISTIVFSVCAKLIY